MGDTFWGTTVPMGLDDEVRAIVGTDGEAMLLLQGLSLPDQIRLPPELGGQVVKPLGQRIGGCPGCESRHEVRLIDLPGGMLVAECEERGFLWCKTSG